VPESWRQRLICRPPSIVVVRGSGGVFKLPIDITGFLPRVGIRDIGIIRDCVHDLECHGINEIVAEASVQVLVRRDRGHYPCDGRGSVGTLDGCIVAIDDPELVGVGVAEKCAADGVVESINNCIP